MLHPRFSRLHHERGHCHVLLGDTPSAIAALCEAVRINLAPPASWDMLEQLYRMPGDTMQAAGAAQNLAALQQLPTELAVANSPYADGDLALAGQVLRDYVRKDAVNVGTMRLFARICSHSDAPAEAEGVLVQTRLPLRRITRPRRSIMRWCCCIANSTCAHGLRPKSCWHTIRPTAAIANIMAPPGSLKTGADMRWKTTPTPTASIWLPIRPAPPRSGISRLARRRLTRNGRYPAASPALLTERDQRAPVIPVAEVQLLVDDLRVELMMASDRPQARERAARFSMMLESFVQGWCQLCIMRTTDDLARDEFHRLAQAVHHTRNALARGLSCAPTPAARCWCCKSVCWIICLAI